MEPLRNTSVLRFGQFEVCFESGELRKSGLRIRVQQLPMKMLQILVERPGQVVTREELRQRVWVGESFGDFDQAVNIAIGKLRNALGDSAESPRYIETLPKRGYRFIAEVAVIEPSPTQVSEPAHEDSSPTDSEQGGRWWSTHRVSIASALVLSLTVFGIWLSRSLGRSPISIRSIAVLPLDNFSGDPSQDYFADGMTDELITNLAQIKALRVISRTSVMIYKGAHKPLPEIARELDVDAVVEGSVVRSGDQIRITAQLIQAPTDKHLWAESYQGNLRDTLSLQRRVASAVADQIRIEVTPQEQAALKRVEAVDPDAYEDYLKGRYFWNERTTEGLKKAIDYFDQAIGKDPNYAQAYSGLADSYALLGDWQYAEMTPKEAMPRAKTAAMKAVELDDNLGEGHNSLAFCLDGFDWDFDAADREFRRSITLNPGYASAHHWYSWHLALMGRNTEAIAEMKKAEDLDPVSPIINSDLAELLLIARLPDQSIQQSRKTIDMNPNFASAHNQLAQAFIEKQMFHEAILELQKAIQLSGGSSTFTANLARAYVGLNKKGSAKELLNDLIERSAPGYPDASEIAKIYVALGDNDKAMTWLEKGYENRFNPGVLLRPGFDPLRGDPRFKDLVRRVGLPQQ
jgi:TolB-like protein/DNA-binding winged helix-turn-helix (wHTH) protein/Tfp pilus assembly protein PilF